jgi:hypothetical protein
LLLAKLFSGFETFAELTFAAKHHYQVRRISSASIKKANLPEQRNGRTTPFDASTDRTKFVSPRIFAV